MEEKSEENDCYFLGSIVVVDKRGTIYSDIIDGQQRIITLMILLNVIAKNFNEINSNVERNSETPVVTSAIVNNRIKNENILGEFVNYIFYNVNIIKIVCTNESFGIKLFQVMNDRGMQLSSSDIIKSYK